MANLLVIEKLPNNFFRFTLNGDTANSVENIRNDLTIVSGKCHFKTENGANIIKEQDIDYFNITLVNGLVTVIPTSNADLIDKLTLLEFFSWIDTSGSGGVDRFSDLLDTFDYFGRANQIVSVNPNELELSSKPITFVEESIDLSDMPSAISADLLLIGNSTGTEYIPIHPVDLPVSTDTINAINSAIAFVDFFPKIQITATAGQTSFDISTNKLAKAVFREGALLDDADWEQIGSIIVTTFPFEAGERFKPI